MTVLLGLLLSDIWSFFVVRVCPCSDWTREECEELKNGGMAAPPR